MNPIERRVALLTDQWTEFAQQEQAKLLVWQAEPAELPLIEAFFAKETDEACETTDMFVRLQTGFTNSKAHGYALREELIAQYAASRAEAPEAAGSPAWSAPHAKQGDTDTGALLRTLESFHAHHAEDIALLGVWLDPSA